MSNDLNQCTFVGRLGADPETRTLPQGSEVANFRIACGWKGKDKEGTEWVPIVAFGKLAEICGKYLSKGSQVLIVGQFRTRKWQDKDGNDRYTTEIVADRMQMLGGKSDNARSEPIAGEPEPDNHGGGQPDDSFDDDIPF